LSACLPKTLDGRVTSISGLSADLAALRAALSLALAEMRSQGSADAIGTARAIPITREEANRIGAA
jgi:hypothetical protein